jgi:fructokinase
MPTVLAAVEGGGTTFRAAIAHDDASNIVARAEFETTTPTETLAAVREWLSANGPFDALGIASFGPIDLREGSNTYGYITSTPKVLWRQADVVGPLTAGLDGVPFAFDTDVNAPAMSEFARMPEGSTSCAYITVGTGVGVGLVVNGRPVHGLLHPEAGHVAVPPYRGEGTLQPHYAIPGGVEANASSGAIAARKGLDPASAADRRKIAQLDDDDPVWDVTAYYLAGLCVNLILVASPEKIVFGGGVLKRACLFPKIRAQVKQMLNGYLQAESITDRIDEYIVSSDYGDDAGLIGALALAKFAADGAASRRARL